MAEPAHHLTPDQGPYDRSLRAADRDRDAVADILREQHLAGRLETDELQERVERCYAAKTYAELDAVLADLPAQGPRPQQTGGLDSSTGRRRWPAPPLAWVPLLPVLIVAIALSHGHLVWLVPALLFFCVIRPLRWHAAGAGLCGGTHGSAGRHRPYV
jgi:hypothetical protein